MPRMKFLATAAAAAMIAGPAIAADVKICVEGAYPPFSETTAEGDVIGFDIDIANALCAEMGKSCELIKTDWDGIIPALTARKCDAIIASMSITEERAKKVDFTNKYYNTPAKFVGKEGVAWDGSPESLAGKTVGVQRGTIHQAFLEGEYPDVSLKLYGTQDEVNLDLTAGRVDAVMADSVALSDGFLKTEAGSGYAFFGGDYSVPKYHGDGAGIAVRKGDDDLRESFNAAIAAIRASGEYGKIQDAYFDFNIYGE